MADFWSDLSSSWSNAWDNYYENGIIPNIWKGITGQKSADRNADMNLGFQKERAAIEDARYEDELAYNRAWAEDERDYSRQLQQQIFDREDTAYLRQAQQLSQLGINPLSQQLNGAGAGQVVSPGAAPVDPVHGATAPQRADTHLPGGILGTLSSFLSLADTVNGVKTGQYQRDALALQNDKQFLENLSRANELGIQYTGYFQPGKSYSKGDTLWFSGPGKDGQPESLFDNDSYKSASYSAYRKQRKDSMPAWQYTLDSFGQDDIYNQAERALTKGSQLLDGFYEKINKDSDKKGFNPFDFILKYMF